MVDRTAGSKRESRLSVIIGLGVGLLFGAGVLWWLLAVRPAIENEQRHSHTRFAAEDVAEGLAPLILESRATGHHTGSVAELRAVPELAGSRIDALFDPTRQGKRIRESDVYWLASDTAIEYYIVAQACTVRLAYGADGNLEIIELGDRTTAPDWYKPQ